MDGKNASIILPPSYLNELKNQKTWEFGSWSKEFHEYDICTERPLRTMPYYLVDDDKLEEFRVSHPNPHRAFHDYIFSENFAHKYLASTILEASKLHQSITVVTWLNCHSLKILSKEIGFRLIFNEIGPLRKPHYLQNAYFDFSGVNGDTSVRTEWSRDKADFSHWIEEGGIETSDVINLLAPLTSAAMSAPHPESVNVGVALQVEDDSNILAHSKDWSSLSLLSYTDEFIGEGKYRTRLHPNGHALYRGPLDCSPSSLHFIRDSREVWTINSSVGIEATFWGKPVRFFGDSPANFLPSPQSKEYSHAWLYFFLCYLTPYSCLFDDGYYEWRLTQPRSIDITKTHLHIYMQMAKTFCESTKNAPSLIDDRACCSVTVDGPWSMVLKERFRDKLAHHHAIHK